MIPNDQPARKEMIQRMLDYLRDKYDDLTSWESDFIDSISIQFTEKGDLSSRQCEILEKMNDKV